MTKKIHVYSTNDCPYCMELKQMLDNHNLPYEVTDVDENENHVLLINGMENWSSVHQSKSKLYFFNILY